MKVAGQTRRRSQDHLGHAVSKAKTEQHCNVLNINSFR